MRDLADVFRHEHGLEEKPPVSFSYSRLVGSPGEVYLKVDRDMITLKLLREEDAG
jgi:hypothetical protein